MTTDVERLVLVMEANMRGYERSMARMQRTTNATAGRVENRFRQQQRTIEGTFTNIQRTATRALGLIGVGMSARAFTGMIQQSLQAAESLHDLSLQVNANVEGLQTLRFAVDQNGGSADLLDRGLRRLAEGMGRVLAGETNEATRALDRLGLGDRIRSGEIQTTDALFRQLAGAMQGIETQAERTAAASQIFGQRVGVQLSQSLSLGTAGLSEFEQHAHDASQVMGEDLVRNAAEANRALREMGLEISGKLNIAVAENAEAIRGMGQALGAVAAAAMVAGAAFAGLFQDPRGAEAIEAEIERLEGRLAALRQRGDGRGDIAGIQTRIQSLRALLELERARPPEENPPRRPPPLETDEDPPGRRDAARERDSSQPVLVDKLAMAMKEADRQRIEDDANKALEMARFQEIAKDFAQTMAEESAREMDRAREDFARTFAHSFAGGVQAAFDGRLQDFLKQRLRDAMFNAMMEAFSNIGRRVFDQLIGAAMSGGGFPFGGARMSGGGVSPGKAYTVGERGAETFVPGMRGSILPNPQSLQGRSSGSGGTLRIMLHVGEGPEFATRVAQITGPMVSDGMQVAVQTSRAEIGADMANRQMRSLR